MTWQTLSSGSSFEQQAPYSRAMFDDEWVFVSGTTGFDYATIDIMRNNFRSNSEWPFAVPHAEIV